MQVSDDQYALYFLTLIARSTTRADSLVARFPTHLLLEVGRETWQIVWLNKMITAACHYYTVPACFFVFSTLSFFCVLSKAVDFLCYGQRSSSIAIQSSFAFRAAGLHFFTTSSTWIASLLCFKELRLDLCPFEE